MDKQHLFGQLSLSLPVKQKMARLMAWPLMQPLMRLGIALTIPRRPVGVSLVAFNAAGQVLLLRHVFRGRIPWGLPGGWLTGQESPRDGAWRELKEETGLEGVMGPVIHVDLTRPYRAINIAYLVTLPPEPMHLSNEIIEAVWFHPDHLPSPLLPFACQAIALGRAHQAPGRVALRVNV